MFYVSTEKFTQDVCEVPCSRAKWQQCFKTQESLSERINKKVKTLPSKIRSLNLLFRLKNSQKPKNILGTVIKNRENLKFSYLVTLKWTIILQTHVEYVKNKEEHHTHTVNVTHLRHFVFLEDERDASAAVVKVTTVGLTLGVQGRRGVGRGTHTPPVAGRREAGEELMLHTLVTSGAGRRVRVRRRRQSFGEEAGPTTAPHLEEEEESAINWVLITTKTFLVKSQFFLRG